MLSYPHSWFQALTVLLLVLVCRAKALRDLEHNYVSSRALAESNNIIIIVAILGVILVASMVVLVRMVFIFSMKMFPLETSNKVGKTQQDTNQISASYISTLQKSDDGAINNQEKFKPSSNIKIIQHDQTITDASLYTTAPERNPTLNEIEEGIHNRNMNMADGISVLSYLASVQNANDDSMLETNIRQIDQTNFKSSPTAKIIKHDQTITDASLYTTSLDESFYGMEQGISNRRMIMIDGVSVLSYIDSAQNAYDNLVPETNVRQNDYHEKSRKQNVVIDGESFETMDHNDPTFISIYSMDEFYPDDDEVANYRTAAPNTTLAKEQFVRKSLDEDYPISILHTIEEAY